MDTDALDHGNDGVGQVFMTVMRVFWGPLTWPLIIVNALAYLWRLPGSRLNALHGGHGLARSESLGE
jgi:hypothetical protein